MMKNSLIEFWNVLVTILNKIGEDDIFTFSAAIAFYTIFSIAPLLVLVLSLAGFFLNEQAVVDQVQYFAGDFLDESMITNIQQYLIQRDTAEGGIWTTILASAAIIFGATTVVTQLKYALNKIWNVEEVRIHSIKNFLFNRLLSFVMIILLSLLLIASLAIEAAFGTFGDFLINFLPDFGLDYYKLVSQIGTIIIATIAFTLIFNILPDVHARWKDVAVGGMVTTILFLIGKYLIAYYFSTAAIEVTYKAAGSLVIFVIWVYYNFFVILVGAVFTQVYTERYGGKINPYRFASLEDSTHE